MDTYRAFEILGLDPDASLVDAKRRFRVLVRKFHPDMTGTNRTSDRYQLVVEAFRVVEGFIVNGPQDEDDDELSFGTILNIIELELDHKIVPIETIDSVMLECSPHDNESGISMVVRLSEPWRGGSDSISMILELGGEYGKMGGCVLGRTSDGKGGLLCLEFEPVF